MWLLNNTPSLLTDLYELTMAQVYHDKGLNETAFFEVTIRRLPPDWGFFVMAGLQELAGYLEAFRFSEDDVAWMRSTGRFTEEFLEYLGGLKLDVRVRALPEGTVFFPGEPVVEVRGRFIDAQLLESYILNILGFSIISASLAARVSIAAKGKAVMDFGLRRTQGPVASIRTARAAMMNDFIATSNVLAARLLGYRAAGTMAHSYIEAHESERCAFVNFVERYGAEAVLLVDTYDTIEGIKIAADVAREYLDREGLRIKGIRIDSGDFVESSAFARGCFKERGVEFLKIFVSGGLDEYAIAELVDGGAEIDGFGIGTRFAVSHDAPDVDIVYKLSRYGARDVYKTSPGKATVPGRKTILRAREKVYVKDIVCPLQEGTGDLLKTFVHAEDMTTIKGRLKKELARLAPGLKKIKNPETYPVEFRF